MAEKIKISSGVKWESIVGYSRAIKAGNMIFIGGTTSIDENGKIVGANNPYLQTKYVIQKIEGVLKQLDASLNDIVRTRIFVRDIAKWEEIGRAHLEYFSEIRPCCTMVEINELISPDMLVEIEVEAVVG